MAGSCGANGLLDGPCTLLDGPAISPELIASRTHCCRDAAVRTADTEIPESSCQGSGISSSERTKQPPDSDSRDTNSFSGSDLKINQIPFLLFIESQGAGCVCVCVCVCVCMQGKNTQTNSLHEKLQHLRNHRILDWKWFSINSST